MAVPPPNEQLRLALRYSLTQINQLSPTMPYSTARLLRITVQTDYFIGLWPSEQWPSQIVSGEAAPTKTEAVELLHQAQQFLIPLPTTLQRHHIAAWQRAATYLQKVLSIFV